MALVADNLTVMHGAQRLFDRLAQWTGGFSPHSADASPFSPEASLLNTPALDPRLRPRAPMSNAEIDVKLLSDLGQLGLKRGKLVTDASHPELMQAWRLMARRAGLPATPQLIIGESTSLNALTASPQEIAITTGLLKSLTFEQVLGVLAHELGHGQSDHITRRALAIGGLGGIGAVIGNEYAHRGGIPRSIARLGEKWPWVNKTLGFLLGSDPGHHTSLLGSALYIGTTGYLGSILGKQLTVRPTELDADAKGAAISGDPLALAGALRVLQKHASRGGWGMKLRHISSGYPTLEARIARLEDIARAQQAAGDPMPSVAAMLADPTISASPFAEHRPRARIQDVASAERVTAASETPALG